MQEAHTLLYITPPCVHMHVLTYIRTQSHRTVLTFWRIVLFIDFARRAYTSQLGPLLASAKSFWRLFPALAAYLGW